MSDIVARLRGQTFYRYPGFVNLSTEAADEIEQLRRERDELREAAALLVRADYCRKMALDTDDDWPDYDSWMRQCNQAKEDARKLPVVDAMVRAYIVEPSKAEIERAATDATAKGGW